MFIVIMSVDILSYHLDHHGEFSVVSFPKKISSLAQYLWALGRIHNTLFSS